MGFLDSTPLSILGGSTIASAASSFTKSAVGGFFNADWMRDAEHASKTFVPGMYAYSPKFKFLFHVYFDINTTALGTLANVFPKDSNFGLAVKTVQLPKYTFDTHTMNQYNRKRIVQTKIKYEPVSIVFHDDNNNVIRKLWYAYYSYYYKDPNQTDTGQTVATTGASKVGGGTPVDINQRTIYQPDISGSEDWGYSGEVGTAPQATKAPFFKAINIYGFYQHNFVLYRLINPIIDSFQHDQYDYSQGNGTMTNTMSLQFEAVKYLEGAIDGKNPGEQVLGFGNQDHYDKTLSPIARPGSQGTILGPGGLVDAGGGIMSDLSSGNYLGAIQKAGQTVQTFKGKNLLNMAATEAVQTVSNSVTQTPNRNTFSFPTSGSTVNTSQSSNTGASGPKTPG